ncbi:MAG: HAD-IA family hydrolase [Geminicoccaceae bacterium]
MTSPLLPARSFAAFLFDMDGTLLDSIAVTNRIWTDWARRHGLDPAPVLAVMHGVRAIETVRRFLPDGDHAHEVAVLTRDELADVDGIRAIPGAVPFVAGLPRERWAVVTSAPRELALLRLAAAGLPVPDLVVTAEDVSRGKPAPDCFRLAAERLGADPADCLVFEDAPAGIAAAEAAGSTVVVIGATHAHPMRSPHPVIPGYTGLATASDARGWLLPRSVERAAA